MFPAILGQAIAAAALSTNPHPSVKEGTVPRQRAELTRLIKAFNRAWTVEPDETTLRGSLHSTYMTTSGERIESRLKLARSAQIVDWKETDVQVDLYSGGQMAIIRYSYELSLAAHGHITERRGRELLVLVREANQWRIVADADADETHSIGAGSGRDAACGMKVNGHRAPAKHHSAPRWIECDYTPESELRLA